MKIPLSVRLICSVTALAFAAPALAQETGSVSDFQLPSEQPTQQPRVQGPVTDGIPAPRVTRPSPTPAPVPTVEASTPAAAPATPTPRASSTPASEPTRSASPTATPAPSNVAEPVAAEATPDAAAQGVAASPAIALPPPAAQPTLAVPAEQAASPASGSVGWWIWVIAILAVGAVGAAVGWFWRGRRAEAPLHVAPVERPRLPEPSGPPAELPKVATARREPPPAPAPALEDEEPVESPLRIALEPARLSLSLLNATLAYRILLTNQGESVLRDISIDGDMISAHASLSNEDQLAAPSSKLENRHLVGTLAPGETKVVRGDFALPLPLIRPIRNGEATLFVPLARLRVIAAGENTEVLVQTSVVGQRSLRPGGGLRPFRLDLGPRIYSELAQRSFT